MTLFELWFSQGISGTGFLSPPSTDELVAEAEEGRSPENGRGCGLC